MKKASKPIKSLAITEQCSSICAFTLLELLVVIAIIGVLVAIILPVFARAKRSAVTTTVISNMRQATVSLNIYVMEYDDVLPLYESALTLESEVFHDPRNTWDTEQNPATYPRIGSFGYAELQREPEFEGPITPRSGTEVRYSNSPIFSDIFESDFVPARFEGLSCPGGQDDNCIKVNRMLVAFFDGQVKKCLNPLHSLGNGGHTVFMWQTPTFECKR
ncbi:MAG: type II secretion system protein [Fimbriimonadaceae bacterium]